MGEKSVTFQDGWWYGEDSIDRRSPTPLKYMHYIYHDASADKICIFVYANGGSVYNRVNITQRCQELGLLQKISSREVYAAFKPPAMQKLDWYKRYPLLLVFLRLQFLQRMADLILPQEYAIQHTIPGQKINKYYIDNRARRPQATSAC